LKCEIWFQNKKDFQIRRTSTEFASSWQKWHQFFSTLLGAIQWTSENENKQYLNQLGGRDDQMMNQWTEDNMVQRKIISEWAYSDQLMAMMFKNSLWSSKPRQQLRAKMYLKDIFISSSWFIISNMAMTIERCYHMIAFEWMLEGCTAPT